jgi:DNA-binding response OmpR family regulator
VPTGPVVAAVINTSPDVVDMLRIVFEQAGIVVVTAFTFQIRDGAVDIETFMKQHNPGVVVYDIAPPYEQNWRLFEHMLTMEPMKGRQVVITTANAAQLEKIIGGGQQVYEVVGKPYDLDQIVRAVKEAGRARPTR